jgi:DNA-binding Lrp family transcriptional regulator
MAKPGKEAEIIKNLQERTNGELKGAWPTYGDYDIILKTEVDDLDKLSEFVISQISTIPNILSTSVLIGV